MSPAFFYKNVLNFVSDMDNRLAASLTDNNPSLTRSSELLGNKLPSFRNLPWRSQVGDLLLFLLDRVTYYGMTATMRPVVRQAIPGEPPVLSAVIVRPSPEATPQRGVC